MPLGGFLTYIDAIRDADKIGIFEFDAGALVAVIEQDVDAGGFELGGELLAGLRGGVGNVGDGDDDVKGAMEAGSQKPLASLRLLDGGGEDALDADAVAAHDRHDFLAVGVEDARRPWTRCTCSRA